MESTEKQVIKTLYYVQDTVRGTTDSMVWWKKGNHGYTCDLKKARVWLKEEMEVTCAGARDLKAWPKAYIDQNIQYHINLHDLDPQHAEAIDY